MKNVGDKVSFRSVFDGVTVGTIETVEEHPITRQVTYVIRTADGKKHFSGVSDYSLRSAK